ncbi:type II secretion system protein GspL [Pseudomonas sp. COR58]|uniref:Type II secretion system protein GspL n=1 Tax=Pseudomonas ekonensis TaxID=2842353 RepID=A0ABS6PEZ2_9PSED|nr:type II secretion system protein GspL [Pseudomonas ekonensis]MBV4458764.1 type II secretion system protein GspL [Pseudomonas ekonensis]
MTPVRVGLPPLAQLSPDSELSCVWLDRQGQVVRQQVQRLGQLPAKTPLVCFLHPVDSLLASLDLPPLPNAKMAAAVQCAAQTLMLGDVAAMHVAHGPRDDAGQVAVAWLARQELQQLGRLLRQAGLHLKGLYPVAYGLPVMAGGVGCVFEGHLLLRDSLHTARIQPLLDDGEQAEPGVALHWIGDDAPQGAQPLPSGQRCSGPLPAWGLHAGLQQPVDRRGWGRALGCAVLALTVWVTGLNLYAAREAAQGQQLKAQMMQRVKQAFPELPVILNPLQQARQQLAARQQGAADDPGQAFSRLVLQAGSGMPFMAGSVQRLTFVDGALQLSLLDEARAGSDKGWQDTLAQAGISVSHDADGWTLRPAGEALSTAGDDDGDNSGAEDE